VQADAATAEVLKVANAVFFDKQTPPSSAALDKIRGAGADTFVDYLSSPEAIKRINDWVSEKTKALIPSIIDQPLSNAGLVGLNALYFKDRWRTPFVAGNTAPAPFHRLDASTVTVAMMKGTASHRLRSDDRFAAVELPYANDRFSLVLATTKDKPASLAEFTAVQGWFGGEGFAEERFELALPRFTLEGSESLLAALDALGLSEGRNSPTAFKGFSPTPQAISEIVQKTFMRVDEAGTEAAAATAVVATRSMQHPVQRVAFDKPFVFALRDRTTGFVLLSGYMANPTAVAVAEAPSGSGDANVDQAAPDKESVEPEEPR
jgi:serpin B